MDNPLMGQLPVGQVIIDKIVLLINVCGIQSEFASQDLTM